jgi:hypothetical protein
MNDIIEPTIDHDFSKLYLGPPSTIAGGAYFTRIMYNNNKQLYIQTPKSLTKQGFVKSGKKIYVDLMFDNNDTVFISWIENLEAKCQELIFSKGDNWFQTKLDKDDIESTFTSPFKIYKSGKFYLLRVNVKPNIKVFNDDTNIINLDDITNDKTLISIIEIQGIKFTSRNFQIEIELKQSMVVSPDPFLDACFIKTPDKRQSSIEDEIKDIVSEPLSFSNIDIDKKTELNTAMNTAMNSKTVNSPNIKTSSSDLIAVDLDFDFDLNSNSNSNSNSKSSDNNIILDIEDLSDVPITEDSNILKEFDLSTSLGNDLESFTLKKPNQVYYDIYRTAREKAKNAKKEAILAFLEAKNIKKTYMLDDMDESDDEADDLNFNEAEEL